MRAREFLLEYKSEAAINAILAKFGDQITRTLIADLTQDINARQFGNEPDPRKLLDLIINADPTKNSMYVNWILARYLSNEFRYLEDIGKAHELLSFYEKAKPMLDVSKRDINQFKTFKQLYTFINDLKNAKVDTQSNREKEREYEKELIESGEAEIYYNSPDIKIIIPRTKQASCYFGRNTQWCTAAKRDNRFDDYSESGNLYIILFKKTNKRWQFHLESVQFMDEQDDELSIEQVQSVGHLFPDTYLGSDKKAQLAAIKEDGFLIRYIENPSEQVQLAAVQQKEIAIKYIKNPSKRVQLAAVKENGHMIAYIDNPSEQVQLAAVKENGYAIDSIDYPSEQVQLAAVKNNGNSLRYIQNPSERVQLAAVKEDMNAVFWIEHPTEKVLKFVRELGYKS